MKKLITKLLILIGILILPTNVFAAGNVSVSTGSLSMTEGGTSSFSITANNAAGQIVVQSSNPSVATVSVGTVWIENQTISVKVTGKSAGTAKITVTLADVATFDEEVLSGVRTINVTVKPKSNNNGGGTKPSTPSKPTDTRSSNTNLSKLTIDGETISKKDGKYTLKVSNYVDNITIGASAEYAKAKVSSGTGNKSLKVGENTFDVVVTAENGKKTTHKVVVVRREYNSLSDLDELLKLNKDVTIKLGEDENLSKDDIAKISDSENKVTLNRVSEDNKVLYSWILDGKELNTDTTFNPNISIVSNNNEDMEKALNYADGIYLDFSKCGDIPEGAILKYFVFDKYKDGNKINLYVYDEKSKKVKQLESDITVNDGFVELKISDTMKHFISKAKIGTAEVVNKDGINIWFIISMVLIVVVLILLVVLISKNKNNDKKLDNTVPVEELVIKPFDASDNNN